MRKINSLNNRFTILIVLVCIVGIILIGQLFNLQIVNGESYREQSEKRLVRDSETYAPRGEIYDRYGKLLVTSEAAYVLQLYRTKISSQELNNVLLRVAEILEKNGDTYYNEFPIDFELMEFTNSDSYMKTWKKNNKIDEDADVNSVIEFYKEKYDVENQDINEIKKIIAMRYEISSNGYSSYRAVTLAKNISYQSVLEIEEKNAELSGVYITKQPVRKYLSDSVAAHILGYTGKISNPEYQKRKEEGYSLNDIVGKSGIESSFEEFLRGKNGTKRLEMDSYGRISNEEEIEQSSMGNSIVLTLDLDLQTKTEEVLEDIILQIQNGKLNGVKYNDATAGAAVVLEVKTGEVLAMASYPSYNPSDFIDGISNSEYNEYFNGEDKPMFNRAIQGTYPPGSTFKMVTGIAAIESGGIGVEENVNDTGVFYLGHKPACWIWNSRRQVHGNVNAKTALMVSCNYYYYEVASRIGIDKIAEYARKFGLGEKTGIELYGEASGTVASREYVEALNKKGVKKTWTIGDTLSASIGQSYNTFTPLQMCYYISTLANKGKKTDVTIVKDVIDAEGNSINIQEVRAKLDEKLGVEKKELQDVEISEKTINAIFEGMRSVTGDHGGTVYGTFSSFPIEVAGKTGTATSGNGSDNAWFVGFAPYDNPEIAVVVIVEHGGHGYFTARAVKDIMEEYFGYNNDKIDEKLSLETSEIKILN
ncbi:MAG: penicillin-binding protein 2 [Clostridia bacterium]|nr:penicillin-binding protein 2 [Clostridia bacterium]